MEFVSSQIAYNSEAYIFFILIRQERSITRGYNIIVSKVVQHALYIYDKIKNGSRVFIFDDHRLISQQMYVQDYMNALLLSKYTSDRTF